MKTITVREELITYGGKEIDTVSLMVILTGIKKGKVIELLDTYENIDILLLNASDIVGITEVQKGKLLALKELRARKDRPVDFNKVTSPDSIFNLYRDEMSVLEVEHFDIVMLNTKNMIIDKVNIAKGTINATLVHPREVFKEAIRRGANSIILCHNHPSGISEPSKEDVSVTSRLDEVGALVGIKVLDHIIIGKNEYTSFKERKLL